MSHTEIYNRLLVDFSMIYDTDFGLLKLISKEFNNPMYFDIEYLNSVDDDLLRLELINMEKDDPLDIILTDKEVNKEFLYDQFYSSHYEEIINLSSNTNLLYLLNNYKETGTAEITILCKNELEEHFIRINNPSFNVFMIKDDFCENDLKKFDTIYIKSIYSISKLEPFEAKNILISNHRYNFEDYENLIPKMDIVSSWIYCNKLFVVDIYNNIKFKG